MKNYTITLLLILPFYCGYSQQSDIQSLQKTYYQWVQAWNERDAQTVAKISWGNFGFGRDVPFMRTGAPDQSSYEKGIQGYMDQMKVIDYKSYYENFKIVDTVGLINGFYAQTTQQSGGPLRTVYGRQSLVLTQQKGEWKIIHYHRSPLPNEFVR